MVDHILPEKTPTPIPKEGDLYKEISLFGQQFRIFYGYYEECDRKNPAVDPMPIYPDFIGRPVFTPEGLPFVTKMQDACGEYRGKDTGCPECADCLYYQHGEALIGLCVHTEKRNPDLGGTNV